VTIKPGLADTPLTSRLPKNLFYSQPAAVARGIQAAIKAKAAEAYVPWFWRYILWGVKLVPDAWLASASGRRHAA
jgi:decaprenylphospho-beta-D-erythro-pentofuranosid-2-ulose 2-reductase